MKLNFPNVPASTKLYDKNGLLLLPDANGQLDIGATDPASYLDLGFTLPQSLVTTATRPAVAIAGTPLFDITLGVPIWRNAAQTGWVNASGTLV